MREDTRSHKHRMGKSKFTLEVDATLSSQKIPEVVQSYELKVLAHVFRMIDSFCLRVQHESNTHSIY